MHTRSPHAVDAPTARRLAVEADADPRTVIRELTKLGSVRGMTGKRVRAVLAAQRLAVSPSHTLDPDGAA